MRKPLSLSILLVIVLFSINATASAQGVTYKLKKIVTTQDQSPVGSRYSSISTTAPSVNIKGEIVFMGTVEEHGSTPYIFGVTKSNSFVVASGGGKTPIGGRYLNL